MAYGYPKFGTGEGNVIDKDGIIASEKFIVVLDTLLDNPIMVLQNRVASDPWGRSGVPIGSVHPRNEWRGAKVVGYQVTEIITEYTNEVLVQYSSDESLAIGVWVGSFKSQTGSENLARELGNPDDPREDRKQIGSPWFRLRKDADEFSATGYATNPDTGTEIALVNVFNPDSTPIIRSAPFERLRVDGVLTFTTTLPRLSFAAQEKVFRLLGKVNKTKWKGIYDLRTLLFVDFSCEDQVRIDQVRQVVQKTSLVSVSFLYHPTGHTPHKLIATYDEPESGAKLVIVDSVARQPIETSYRVYEDIALDDIFSAMGARSPMDR